MDARICNSVRYITHLYCLAIQASFYSDATEIWMCMQRVTGSILSRCKDDRQFSSPLTFCGSVRVHVWAAGSKGTVSSVPAWFRVNSGMNLIKQMEIVTRRRCVWLFSSVVWVLARYAVSSPVTFGGSVWAHVRAASSKMTVPSHCSCEPISLPNITPETQSTCENVSKAYETITLTWGKLPGLYWGLSRSRPLVDTFVVKASVQTWYFPDKKKTTTQCSVLVDTKVHYLTTLSTLYGKQLLLRLTDMYSHWSQKENTVFSCI